MLLNMTMKWPQCYKDILSSLWCFDNWTGKDAKIFDECELSSSEEVEILKYELKQEEYKPIKKYLNRYNTKKRK